MEDIDETNTVDSINLEEAKNVVFPKRDIEVLTITVISERKVENKNVIIHEEEINVNVLEVDEVLKNIR